MNIDELRSAQSKERQKSDLQQLRESFYGDVADYVEELEAERDRIAEQADDPFGSPEVQQLTNDIETAKDTAEAIYERRLGKIVKKASLVSAEMANPNDVSGLTAEEQTLFADLVDRIEDNKTHMMDVIAGDAPPGPADERASESGESAGERSTSTARTDADATASEDATADAAGQASPDAPHPEAGFGADDGDATNGSEDGARPGRSEAAAVAGDDDPTTGDGETEPDVPDPGSVSAADLMGGDAANPDEADATADESGATRDESGATRDESGATRDESGTSTTESDGGTRNLDESTDDATADGDRATLRVTRDVGEIFGVDEREYRLDAEDVVTLPEENADVLVEQGAAERLD